MYDGSGQPVAAQVTYRNARTTVKQDCLPAKAVPRALLTTRQDEWTRGREGRQDKTSQDGDLTQTCVLSCRFRQAIAAATRTHSSRRGRGNGEPVRDHRRGFSGRLGATGSGASDDGRRSSLALLPLSSLLVSRLASVHPIPAVALPPQSSPSPPPLLPRSSAVSLRCRRLIVLPCRRCRRRRRRRRAQRTQAARATRSTIRVSVAARAATRGESERRRRREGKGKNLPLSLQNTCTTFFASLLTQQVGTRRRRQRRRRV